MSGGGQGHAGADSAHPGEGGAVRSAGPGPRQEVGDAESSSRRDAPHVTENDEDAPLQGSTPASGDVAALPANAHGRDVVESQGEVDETSMYDRRPGEDKDRRETDMP